MSMAFKLWKPNDTYGTRTAFWLPPAPGWQAHDSALAAAWQPLQPLTLCRNAVLWPVPVVVRGRGPAALPATRVHYRSLEKNNKVDFGSPSAAPRWLQESAPEKVARVGTSDL